MQKLLLRIAGLSLLNSREHKAPHYTTVKSTGHQLAYLNFVEELCVQKRELVCNLVTAEIVKRSGPGEKAFTHRFKSSFSISAADGSQGSREVAGVPGRDAAGSERLE